MKRMPTIKQLQHLVSLFDYQHFGKAASACFITQSTMSASIVQLEEALDAQLIERDHKNFIFTELGKQIVQMSRTLIEQTETIVDYAKNEGKPMHGTLRLGCIPTIAPFLMSALVAHTQAKYPELKLLIREDTTDHLLHLLEIGQLELIILALPYPIKNIHTQILGQDPFQLVLPASWIDKIKIKDMSSWPDESIFFLEKEHCLTEQTLQACSIKNSNKINPFFANSLHTLMQMVIVGLGVTIFPQLAIKSGILNGTDLITSPLPANAFREIGIAWRINSHKQQSYKLLATMITDLIKHILE